MEWAQTLYSALFTWPVAIYVMLVVAALLVPPVVFAQTRRRVVRRRQALGLPQELIMEPEDRLRRDRREAGLQALVLLVAIFVVPLVLAPLLPSPPPNAPDVIKGGFMMVFLAILLWLIFQGTDVAKAFLGGLSFKTMIAFQDSMQVGDRVTLTGYGGRLLKMGTFFVTLQTPDDDLVSIPTQSLWSEVLISANAGNRASRCVMQYYLAPFASKSQRQAAEDAIWDAIQASPYCETAKPMQIFLSQTADAICLTAKAYVTSTYDEPLFKSDVTRAFLDVAAEEDIPLGSSRWRMHAPDMPALKV